MSTLKQKYVNEVAPALMKKFGYKSPMQIPKIDKVIVNVGAGEARENAKVLDAVVSDLAQITGQRPVITKAQKSVANFKLRQGMPIGAKVTLRAGRMYEFLDRLFNIALPRVRDFRGINPDAFDGRGNYSLGLKEQLIFPEIDFDKIDKIRGMNVVICTTANTDEEARALLEMLGAPFTKA
ncbi:MAG TPA: 50S ribosomal protein L5 [Clostridiales bacterium]|jgi:large subunit ribosomal protein L5|nr:50S ribosomal protein L5 [Clostridiales bacterium]